MKNLNLYAMENELNLGDPKSGTIRVPFGRWDFGAKKLDDGRYLKHLDSLMSVSLINIPNIQEFRLANELQGGLNNNERTFAMPRHLIDLARRFDERKPLANKWLQFTPT